jgi:hypothetical protein
MDNAPIITVAGRAIGAGRPCFVIAEVGINHGGDEARCAAMIDAAATAGADAVKLQTVTAEESYHPDTESYRLFRDSVLAPTALERLMTRARQAGVILFSTPGDFTALHQPAADPRGGRNRAAVDRLDRDGSARRGDGGRGGGARCRLPSAGRAPMHLALSGARGGAESARARYPRGCDQGAGRILGSS